MGRKKKNVVKEKKDVVQTLEDFTLGDTVWFSYIDGRILSGEIKKFFVDPVEGNCATIMTPVDGYRSTKLENCSYAKIVKKRTKLNKKSNKK